MSEVVETLKSIYEVACWIRDQMGTVKDNRATANALADRIKLMSEVVKELDTKRDQSSYLAQQVATCMELLEQCIVGIAAMLLEVSPEVSCTVAHTWREKARAFLQKAKEFLKAQNWQQQLLDAENNLEKRLRDLCVCITAVTFISSGEIMKAVLRNECSLMQVSEKMDMVLACAHQAADFRSRSPSPPAAFQYRPSSATATLLQGAVLNLESETAELSQTPVVAPNLHAPPTRASITTTTSRSLSPPAAPTVEPLATAAASPVRKPTRLSITAVSRSPSPSGLDMSPAQALVQFQAIFTRETQAIIVCYDDIEFACQLCQQFAVEEGKAKSYETGRALHHAAEELKNVLASSVFGIANMMKEQIKHMMLHAKRVVSALNIKKFHDDFLQDVSLIVQELERMEQQALQTGNIPHAHECHDLVLQIRSEANKRMQNFDHANDSLSKLASEADQLLSRQPTWPRHDALLRFDAPLQRLTTQHRFTKKWKRRFFLLRGSRLYFSKGEIGHEESHEKSLMYMRSHPEVDGHFCMDLTGASRDWRIDVCECLSAMRLTFCCCAGCSVVLCREAINGQDFVFEIHLSARDKVTSTQHTLVLTIYSHNLQQPARNLFLAASDDVTRQRCVRIIQAASTCSLSSHPQEIAPAAALSSDLLGMKSVKAIKTVLSALNVPWSHAVLKAAGLDLHSLKAAGFSVGAFVYAGCNWEDVAALGFPLQEIKAAGCDIMTAKNAGYDELSLAAAFGLDAAVAAGCDVSFLIVRTLAAGIET
jgi:hypothetical protein